MDTNTLLCAQKSTGAKGVAVSNTTSKTVGPINEAWDSSKSHNTVWVNLSWFIWYRSHFFIKPPAVS